MKDDTLLIANAVITEIDTEKQTITVKDDVDESTLGEECLTECSSIPMVYCDFATQKVTKISFEDLQVNDKVIMCIRSSEMENFRSGGNEENTLKVEQARPHNRCAHQLWLHQCGISEGQNRSRRQVHGQRHLRCRYERCS